MDPATLTTALKEEATRLGFELSGTCPAVTPPSNHQKGLNIGGIEGLRCWLAAGYAGQMNYLGARYDAYEHPRHVLEGARSLLVLGAAYRTAEPQAPGPGQGRVSRYAWGTDYHRVIRERLHQLTDFHRHLVPGAAIRGVIDTAPLLERDFARLAGLGWIGKNTLLLNRQFGSWFFLAVLLTSEELVYDEPFVADHCGTCRACLDACPTQALIAPYRLDARRCISYLTIELRDAIPHDLRQGMGQWLFGCDVCQEVCPWNRRAPRAMESGFEPLNRMNPVDLGALFDFDEAGFRARFAQTPLARPKRAGILRNAVIVLGNQRDPAALPALAKGLDDPDPTVREACAWAIERCKEVGKPPMNTNEHR